MHTQYLAIEEDIEFPKVASAKQMPRKSLEAKHREIEITFTISSGLKHGQGVSHSVPQYLYYNLVVMHKLNHNIQEVMTFSNWLSVKQNLQKLLSEICAV
jgi:hypothetical protein